MCSQKQIALVIPYFGSLPEYADAFFFSLKYNPQIDVLLFTDNPCTGYSDNLKVIYTTFDEIRERIQSNFDFDICLKEPYKLCDYKPAYGVIFERELREYEFWGHCDLDMILGDIMSFLPETVLTLYDKFYQHGHLCIYRNTAENNRRFMLDAGMNYKNVFSTDVICVFDEVIGMQRKFEILGLDTYQKRDCADIDPWHADFLRVESHLTEQERIGFNKKKQVFFWEKGRIYRAYLANGEIFYDQFNYLHFQKRNLKLHFDINNPELNAFYITPFGFFEKKEDFGVTVLDIEKYSCNSFKVEIQARVNRQMFIWKRRIRKYIQKYVLKE